MSWKEKKEAGMQMLWDLERSLNLSEPQTNFFKEG